MSDNPFEDENSLYNEMLRAGKQGDERPKMRFGLTRGEASEDETALPFSTTGMNPDDISELMNMIQSGNVEGVLERLSLTKDMLRRVMLAHGLVDTMSDGIKDHIAIQIMDPEHECGITEGVLPPEAEERLSEMKWSQEHADAFKIVEANVLGMFMMLRTTLLLDGYELPVYPQFPDVPAFAKSGVPPDGGSANVNLGICEVCGEYELLCECGGDGTG